MTLIAYIFRKLQNVKDMVWEMSKKSRFRKPYDKQDDKRAQTLLKSQQKHVYHLY